MTKTPFSDETHPVFSDKGLLCRVTIGDESLTGALHFSVYEQNGGAHVFTVPLAPLETLIDEPDATFEADRLREINAELLAALKELDARATDAGNALSKMGQGATLLGMASRKARAAIAKAEETDR